MRHGVLFASLASVVAALAVACGGSPPPEPVTPPPAPTTPPAPTAEAPPPPPKPEAPQKTLAQKMEDTTKALVDAWNAHDADKVAAAYSENGMLRIVGMPDAVGRAAIKAATADTLKAYPDFKVAPTRVTTKGNVAFVEWVITGTNTGDSELMKIKATKRPMGVYGVDVATYDDNGLVKDAHRYFDMPTQMMQLDAKAKAGSFRPVAALPSGNPVMAISKDTEAEKKNLEAAKAVDKAWESHKSDAIIALGDPEMTLDDYTMPSSMKGAKAQKPFLDGLFKAIPDMKSDVGVRIAADDLVATESTVTGTMKGNMGPLKATNKPVTMHMVDIVKFKDGKVSQVWAYGNSMQMMPPPAEPKAATPAKEAAPKKEPAKEAPKKK